MLVGLIIGIIIIIYLRIKIADVILDTDCLLKLDNQQVRFFTNLEQTEFQELLYNDLKKKYAVRRNDVGNKFIVGKRYSLVLECIVVLSYKDRRVIITVKNIDKNDFDSNVKNDVLIEIERLITSHGKVFSEFKKII